LLSCHNSLAEAEAGGEGTQQEAALSGKAEGEPEEASALLRRASAGAPSELFRLYIAPAASQPASSQPRYYSAEAEMPNNNSDSVTAAPAGKASAKRKRRLVMEDSDDEQEAARASIDVAVAVELDPLQRAMHSRSEPDWAPAHRQRKIPTPDIASQANVAVQDMSHRPQRRIIHLPSMQAAATQAQVASRIHICESPARSPTQDHLSAAQQVRGSFEVDMRSGQAMASGDSHQTTGHAAASQSPRASGTQMHDSGAHSPVCSPNHSPAQKPIQTEEPAMDSLHVDGRSHVANWLPVSQAQSMSAVAPPSAAPPIGGQGHVQSSHAMQQSHRSTLPARQVHNPQEPGLRMDRNRGLGTAGSEVPSGYIAAIESILHELRDTHHNLGLAIDTLQRQLEQLRGERS